MAAPLDRGRMETNLCRAPLWQEAPSPIGVVTRSLLGEFEASIVLSGLDLKVLAFILERWGSVPRDAIDEPAGFTLYEVGQALHGHDPTGGQRRALRASLERLFEVEITLVGYDVRTGTTDSKIASRQRLLQAIRWHLEESFENHGEEWFATAGALRGSAYSVTLASWLARQLQGGYATYLDLRILRQLREVAARVWVYLEAEDWRPKAGRKEVQRWLALNPKSYRTLGVHHTRERDARAALARACDRIMLVDGRYAVVSVQETNKGWCLLATRHLDSRVSGRTLAGKSRPISRSERVRIRRQVEASINEAGERQTEE